MMRWRSWKNGHTDELPRAGADAARVRPCDMWASARFDEWTRIAREVITEQAGAIS